MNFSDKTVLSVKALNDFVKRIVENNNYLSSVNIRGEISNFTNHYKSGHLYFSIKDEEAAIRCVMFSSSASKLTFEPKDGMKITAHGRVSLFVRDGQFVFYVDKLEVDGVGELYLKFEQIKKKLGDEGLFSSLHKQPIPKYPKAIGIITSETGAAIVDIKNIITRRFPLVELILYPSLVQGSGAEDNLCSGIKYFSEKCKVDTVIIGRGGGSIEDLWAFNSEKLARCIYDCPIPVISAVGHETDFTICDFVADLRAPTPSAAAELAVPDKSDLVRQLGNVVTKMQGIITHKISWHRLTLERLSKCRFLQSPDFIIDDKRMHTEYLMELMSMSMQRIIDRRTADLSGLNYELVSAAASLIERKRTEYVAVTAKLEALNPMSVIARGYSAVFDNNGRLLNSVDDIEIDSEFNIRMTNGTVTARAVQKRSDDNG